MWFKRTDKLFAKAASDPEQCDRLIKHYRRVRVGMFAVFLLTAGGLIAFAAWFFVQAFRFLEAMGGSRAGYTTPPFLGFILQSRGEMWLVLIPVAVFGITSLYFSIGADAMAKTLLMFRTLQKGESADAGD
jgi:hypothetical protein